MKRPRLFYRTDILWIIGWIALTIGAFWLWNHYETRIAETLFMTLLICCPFLVCILVVPERIFEWTRWKDRQ